MPVLFATLLPVIFVLQAILTDNATPVVRAFASIPLGAVHRACGWVQEPSYPGRMFRASLLASGQDPGPKVVLERLKGGRLECPREVCGGEGGKPFSAIEPADLRAISRSIDSRLSH